MIRKLLFFVRFLCVCIGHWGLCSVGHWDLCSVGHWNVILIWITLPMRATSDASPHYGPKMNADLDFRASW